MDSASLGPHNSVSVNINVDANLHRSQSAIKLTFSSTINGHQQAQQQMTPMTAPDLCKTELDPSAPGGTPGSTADPSTTPGLPADQPPPQSAPATGTTSTAEFPDDNEFLDELSDLLDKLEEDPRCYAPAAPGETNVRPGDPSGLYASAPGLPGMYPTAYAGGFPTPPSSCDNVGSGVGGLMLSLIHI